MSSYTLGLGPVHSHLLNLPAKEAMVLRMRFGFDEEPQTLKEVGEKIGVSKERVMQIQKKVLLEN